jgi:hypothetical protein
MRINQSINHESHNLVDETESEDQGDTTLHDSSGTRETIVARPRR